MTSTACGASPTSSSVGGPAPYWLDWTFDAAGDRASQVAHGSGSATGDTTTTYTYNGAGTGQPHVLTGVTSVGPAGTSTASYQYDGLGQTVSRPAQLGASAGTQTLTWDGEGHVATEKDSAGATSYVYDADGNRLIARTRGHTTAYLDSTELTLDKAAGTLSARRSYMFGGAMIAARNNGSVSFIATDLHDSGEIATDSSTLVSTPRRFDPYGNGRGVQPGSGSLAAWPSSHGFVNGVADGDGLTHLGAREYDPSIGRFISPDPLLDTGDPQQLNGYAYSDNAPTTRSDPTGLRSDAVGGHMVGNSGGKPGKVIAKVTGGTKKHPQYEHDTDRGDAGIEQAGRSYDAYQAAHRARRREQSSGGRHFWSGYGTAIANHAGALAADTITTTVGIYMIGAGVGGEVGGLALDVTGVGVPAGVAVGVGSAGLITAGAGLLAGGAVSTVRDLNTVYNEAPGDYADGSGDAAQDELPAIKGGSSNGPTAGQKFSESVRKEVLEDNPSTCVYCRMDTESPQVDHVVPRSRGGDATVENGQTTCAWCNNSKNNRDFPVNPPGGYEGPWPPPWWNLP